MDGESFAERLKKFNQQPVMGIRTPKPHMTHSVSSLDSTQPEKLERSQPNDLYQAFDDTNPTKSNPTPSSSESSNERTLPRDAKLAQIFVSGLKKSTATLPKSFTIDRNENKQSKSSNHFEDTTTSPIVSSNTTIDTNVKKPPATLPKPLHNDQKNNNKRSESITIAQNTILYYPHPLDSNTFTDVKKSSMFLPASDQDERQDSYVSSNFEEEMPSSVIYTNTDNFISAKKEPASLPNSVNLDQREDTHNDFVSISLDTMLSPKCMFYEFESMINDYKRRDPRTIIYRKMKISMPKITTNEINILQRYSNK
ncbi:unnamed protein product [Rotaria sp. Silwood1]|nr:unnamed protein product [Rotaria sp. Silwood1]